MMKGFPRRSYYGKNHVAPTRGGIGGSAPATKKQIDSFEQEYQKFIADLKAKKEAEVIPETVTTVAEVAPVLNEETQPKKTKKKKAEPVVETVAEPTIDGLD